MTKDILVAGNWKSNKTLSQAEDFFRVFSEKIKGESLPQNLTAVVFPSLIHLEKARFLINDYRLPLKLGAQNLSARQEGAFTGEVAASQLSDLVEYILIGHSERRKNYAEDDEILAQKSARAIEAGLKIIYCVSDKNDRVPDGVDIVAYEPVWAIGTGKAATAQEAEETASAIKSKHPKVSRILYGGSVNPDNIVEFLKMPTIGGVLPGKTSLDPDQFFRMLKNAAE